VDNPTPLLYSVYVYYVYLLKSKKDGFIYTSFTPDLKNRLTKHQNGLVKSTRLHLPIELVYAEIYKSKQDAVNREYQLKKHAKAMG